MQRQQVTRSNVTPLHHQVYVVLRQQIEEGLFSGNRQIPSEHALSDTFNVSRITIRRAMDRLKQEGLISRTRGRGTFAQTPRTPQTISADLRDVFENLMEMGRRTRVRVVEFGYVPAPAPIAERLGLTPGAPVQRAVRVRYHEKTPFSHLTTYLPEDVGQSFTREDLAQTPLLSLMERAGIRPVSADQSVTAKLADTMVAPLLGVETGSPLLWVKRSVMAQDGRAVEFLQALYRPDMYEYQMSVSRRRGDAPAGWALDDPRG